MGAQQLLHILWCHLGLEITPIMTKAYIIDILQVLPSPILGGQLTIKGILLADMDTSVVTDHIRHLVLVSGDGPSHMYRRVDLIMVYSVRLMTRHSNFNPTHILINELKYLICIKRYDISIDINVTMGQLTGLVNSPTEG